MQGTLGEAEACLERADVSADEVALIRGFNRKARDFTARQENGVKQETALETWAKSRGIWFNDFNSEGNLQTALDSRYTRLDDIQGSEPVIYRKDSKTLVKEISLSHTDDNPRMLLDRLVMYNLLFPSTALNVIGFERDELGHFKVIAEQKFVEFDSNRKRTTPEEIERFATETLGLHKRDNSSWWYSNDESVRITDLGPNNVLRASDGTLVVINCDIELEDKNAGIETATDNTSAIYTQLTNQENAAYYRNPERSLVHAIPYSMYGIVTSVPEHAFDKTITIGTQLQKIIAEDIPDNAVFEFNGEQKTRAEMTLLKKALSGGGKNYGRNKKLSKFKARENQLK